MMGDYTEHLISMAGGDGDDASGMAGVLAAHQNWSTTNDSPDGIWRMMCFDCKADLGPYEPGQFDNIFATHQSDMLTAAGLGKL